MAVQASGGGSGPFIAPPAQYGPSSPTPNPFPWMQSSPAGTPYASSFTGSSDPSSSGGPTSWQQLMQQNGNASTTTGVPLAGQNLANWQAANLPNGGSTSSSSSTAGDDFMNQALAALGGMGGSSPSLSDMTNQANQEASLKYDPLIQQLQQNMSSAQSNEKNASGQIGDLYNSLGRALAAQMPVITNQFASAENQSQQNYQNLQNQINQNYQGAQQAQANELQKLGIQAALPQSTKQLQADQQYLGNQAGVNGQALNDAMRVMGQGQADFAQRASMIAPMQGANIQSNLATQLQQLENQINQQIAGYKGQEGAAASSLLGQLEAAAQKSSATAQQQNFNDIVKLASLEKLTHPGVFGIAPKAPTATKYKGQSGVGQYFADNSQTADPSQMMADFQGFEMSPQIQQMVKDNNGVEPGIDVQWPVLQAYAMQNDPNITNDALNELYNALSVRLGKY